MKKLVLSLTMLLATGLSGFAYDLVVNNGDTAFFYYTITSEEEQTVELSKDSLVYTYYIGDGGESGPRYTYKQMHVVIPETVTIDSKEYTVTALGDNVFSNYKHFADVTFPKTLKTIGCSAFANVLNLKVYVEDIEAWLRIERKWPVDMTGFTLYAGGEKVTDININEPVSKIGDWQFAGVVGLNVVKLFGSVKTVGVGAFQGCDVKEIYVVAAESIGEGAFKDCASLTWASFGSSTAGIPENCCVGCKKLETVTMGNNVKTIGARAFYECSNLKKVVFSSSLEEIGVLAFYSCNLRYTNTTVESLTTIGNLAFSHCGGLKTLPFGNSVKTIGGGAFGYCNSLTSVTIPAGVTVIEPGTFERCASLAEVVIGDGVTEIGNDAFNLCPKLASLTFGKSVKTIGDRAFYNCTYNGNNYSNITSLTIPNSVETIGEGAFAMWWRLESLTIGSGVKTIGPKAFSVADGYGNVLSKITSVTCLGKTPAKLYKDDTFDTRTYMNATLTVPDGAGKAYSAANYWSLFDNIIDNNPDAGDDDGEYEDEDVNKDGQVDTGDVVKIYNRIIYGKGNEE